MTTYEMIKVRVSPYGEVLAVSKTGTPIIRCVVPNNPFQAIKRLRKVLDGVCEDREKALDSH